MEGGGIKAGRKDRRREGRGITASRSARAMDWLEIEIELWVRAGAGRKGWADYISPLKRRLTNELQLRFSQRHASSRPTSIFLKNLIKNKFHSLQKKSFLRIPIRGPAVSHCIATTLYSGLPDNTKIVISALLVLAGGESLRTTCHFYDRLRKYVTSHCSALSITQFVTQKQIGHAKRGNDHWGDGKLFELSEQKYGEKYQIN